MAYLEFPSGPVFFYVCVVYSQSLTLYGVHSIGPPLGDFWLCT